jgi:hypothetical protein
VSVVSPETLPENIPNLSDEDLLRLYNEFASIPAGVSPLADTFHNRAKLLKAEIEKRDQQKERANSFAQWKAEMFQEIHLHDDQMNTLRETSSQAKRVAIVPAVLAGLSLLVAVIALYRGLTH